MVRTVPLAYFPEESSRLQHDAYANKRFFCFFLTSIYTRVGASTGPDVTLHNDKSMLDSLTLD